MKLSVIIPTFNRPDDLAKALNSILGQSVLPNEVIVVDQSENTFTKDLVNALDAENKSKGIRFIWHYKAEKGSAKARNEGFRLSKGDIVSFTDDDVILDKYYLENIIEHFNSNSAVGCVGGNVKIVRRFEGIRWTLRLFLMRLFLLSGKEGRLTASGFGYPIYTYEIKEVTPVDLLAAYSMTFRREIFLQEQFDEWFTGYSFREDVDLSYRVSRRTKIDMIPDARFEHNHLSGNRIDLKNLKKMQFKNYYYVFMKNTHTGFFSKMLFFYSLFGQIVIDLIELLMGFRKDKREAFAADLQAIWAFARGEK